MFEYAAIDAALGFFLREPPDYAAIVNGFTEHRSLSPYLRCMQCLSAV